MKSSRTWLERYRKRLASLLFGACVILFCLARSRRWIRGGTQTNDHGLKKEEKGMQNDSPTSPSSPRVVPQRASPAPPFECPQATYLRYQRVNGSSFDLTLDVAHLDVKYHRSLGWLSQEKEDRFLYEHFFTNYYSGTFVELGGLDGLRFSNTYMYEHGLNWSGLLIEGQTDNYVELERNRGQGSRVVTLHAAMCSGGKILKLFGTGAMASTDQTHARHGAKVSWAPCLRMSDALEMSGINGIDFLSLDVEGAELETLKTIDFLKTPIFVILVEMRKVDENTNPAIRELLARRGFCRFTAQVGHSNEVWIDPEYPSKTTRKVRLKLENYSKTTRNYSKTTRSTFETCIDAETS